MRQIRMGLVMRLIRPSAVAPAWPDYAPVGCSLAVAELTARPRWWVVPRRTVPPGAGSGPPRSAAGGPEPGGGRLKAGQLGTWDLTVSTVANIGPGIDFYFAFGVIAVTAGVAAPLTIVAAGIAVVFLATTVAEFTRAEPSAGSFITYVETALGPRAGVVTALLVTVGYTVAMT